MVSLEEQHMDYFWAAYRMGAWEGQDSIPKGMTIKDFNNFIVGLALMVPMLIIKAPNKASKTRDNIPVGVISCREDRFCIEPHIDWFPWATERNKLEGVVRAALTLREHKPLFIWSKQENIKFFEHVCKYGVMRRIGTFDGKDHRYGLFQSRGK